MMTPTSWGPRPAPGSWVSIGLIYLYGIATTSSLSKIIPVLGDIGTHLGATAGQSAWLISLVGILPAIFASVAGSFVERMGPHRALRLVALVGITVNFAYLTTASLAGFMTIRVFEGLIAIGAYSAAPSLIMGTTSDARRVRAMAVWSTYTPVGFSLGLVMGGAFAGGENWRGGYLLHMVMFGALLLVTWLLPRVAPVTRAALQRAGGIFSAWRQSGPMRLSLTFSVLVLMGFGMSNVYPEWYSRLHGVTPGKASSILAVVNLAMIPAGFAAGALLARGWRDSRMLSVLLVLAVVIAVPLFMPGAGEARRLAVMGAWMLVQGALIAVVTAALPRVVADPRQGAAAAGLLSQLAALVTFVTPLIWQPILQQEQWLGFVAVTAGAAAAVWLLFPRKRG